VHGRDVHGRDAEGWDAHARLGERVAAAARDALAADPEAPALDDARYLDWVADELSDAARRSARRVPHDEYVARGRALRAAVEARRLGVALRAGAPPWRVPTVRGTPSAVLARALAEGATPAVELAAAAGGGRELWDEPCDRWLELPDGLPPARYLALRVRGDSMAPVMRSGDTVLVRLDGGDGGEVQPGCVVIARHPDAGYVCKRVRRVDADGIALDSLAPDGPSFTLPPDGRLVLGTVVMVWRA
jgi:hypothetical protein